MVMKSKRRVLPRGICFPVHTAKADSSSSLRSSSERQPVGEPQLLQHYLVALFQAAQNFRLGAIRDSDIDCDFALAIFGAGVGYLD